MRRPGRHLWFWKAAALRLSGDGGFGQRTGGTAGAKACLGAAAHLPIPVSLFRLFLLYKPPCLTFGNALWGEDTMVGVRAEARKPGNLGFHLGHSSLSPGSPSSLRDSCDPRSP